MKSTIIYISSFIFSQVLLVTPKVYAQYTKYDHKTLSENVVAISQPGYYGKEGTTYTLTSDISSEKSTIFLGKDITLDLNGYTITYADGNYEHIPNSGFEEGLKGWDVSKAPGAKVENTADVHVFLGEKLLSLQSGDEITSPYINLPVANRSYFAMCGITGRYYHDMKKYPDDEMKVSVYVEDENGNEVKCITEYGDGAKQSCPVERRSPRLGGGFVYAHLTNLPAGKYRVRVKADSDCLVDEIDIRPAMDAGISIIEKTTPLAHYDHVIMESRPPTIPAFFDYTEDMKTGKPLSSLPQVSGKGTIIIKNGTIESAAVGILSWGIQSSATNVKVILENLKIKTSGISSAAVDIPYARINNCKFDVDMPFLIQRHVGLCSVIIRGNNATEISNSEFNGGQGCLSIKGKKSLIHDNLFINHQTVTNHYSIMGTGDSTKIYNNRFEPKQGSGIYVSRHTEVFNNIFKIETSPPTCEYGNEEYSTAAIRLGDYGAKPGSPRASVGNRIYDNKIYITAKNYPKPKKYIPMAWGVFYSARAGENYVYGNEIVVNKVESSSKVIAAAFYICGGPKYFGGQFYDNHITTNVPAAWIASRYGSANGTKIYNNTIIKAPGTEDSFKPFRMGWGKNHIATNIEFRSNILEEMNLELEGEQHSYSVYWTLDISVKDKKQKPIVGVEVKIYDRNGQEVNISKSSEQGRVSMELPQYLIDGLKKTELAPYTVKVGRKKEVTLLNQNTELTVNVR